MKNKENKKSFRRIAIVLALILLPIGAFTLGYFYKNNTIKNQVANTLTVDGSIEGSINENVVTEATSMVPGDEVSAEINIKPTSTAKSLLRVKLEPYWMNGSVRSTLPTDNLQMIFSGKVGSDLSDGSWYKNGDYYYYLSKVDKNTDILKLVKGIKFLSGTAVEGKQSGSEEDINKYQGKGMGISVTMDMVQCADKAYKSRWTEDTMSDDLKAKLDLLCEESKKIN